MGRPVELPGSNPLEFEAGRSIGTALIAWPHEHVVKCLVQFHPDDAVLDRLEDETQLRTLYDAVQASGHELLLEVIPPRGPGRAPDTVLRALKRLYNLGIHPEWWKLEPMDAAQWQAVDALIAERDPYCRGVLLLGLGATPQALAAGFAAARASRSCRGFAVGRTIFEAPSRDWLAGRIDEATLVTRVRDNYLALIDAWHAASPQAAADRAATVPA
jgi:5-dehydro-2-deoxygluconokinase